MCLQAKKPLHTGVRTGCHYLISLCVCQCVFNIRRSYRLRELYEPDFHKPGIYGSERVWANAWNLFRRAPSRVGRGCRAAVNFMVCFGWGEFFFRAFHEFAFSNSFVDPVSDRPAWTRRRGSDSQPICPPRTCAHLSPPGVPFSVCLLYTSPSPRDKRQSRMPSSA